MSKHLGTHSAIKLNLFLSLDIPNLSVCQLIAKDRIINKTNRKRKKKKNSSGMILKLAFPSWVRECIDTLQVQLPVAEFLEPFSDPLCNPPSFQVSKGF